MNDVTPADRAAGFKELHVSAKNGNTFMVRVTPMTLELMLGIQSGKLGAIMGTVAKVTGQKVGVILGLKDICLAEVFCASCELADIDLGETRQQLTDARALLARHAPERL